MDLALNDRIDTDGESPFVVNPDPVGKPVLNWDLAQIKAEDETRSTDRRVFVFAAERTDLLEAQLIDRLVESGIVVRGANRRLWFLWLRGGAASDREPFRELRRRIASALISDEIRRTLRTS